jgi:hypothetical protein
MEHETQFASQLRWLAQPSYAWPRTHRKHCFRYRVVACGSSCELLAHRSQFALTLARVSSNPGAIHPSSIAITPRDQGGSPIRDPESPDDIQFARPLRNQEVVVKWRCSRDADASRPEASHSSQRALSVCRFHRASCLLALIQRIESFLTHLRLHCREFPRRTFE